MMRLCLAAQAALALGQWRERSRFSRALDSRLLSAKEVHVGAPLRDGKRAEYKVVDATSKCKSFTLRLT